MKYHYRVNIRNQLEVKRAKSALALTVPGAFSLDQHNRLIYRLNAASAWRRKYALPPKIVFVGNWRLNKNYDLELRLDKTPGQYDTDTLALKGEIISTDGDSLSFEIVSYEEKRKKTRFQILKLSGSWQADENNRIIFRLEKKDKPDVLTLEGIWQVNKEQQISYVYQKTDLIRKSKTLRTLTFAGFWKINARNQLSYILTRSAQSRFDLRCQIESPNLYPQDGRIKYRLGIGLKKAGAVKNKIISLYGAWKFSRKLGLVFTMDYAAGRTRSISFDTELSLCQRDKIILGLKNQSGQPLGMNITFNRRLIRGEDAELFLRLKHKGPESAVEAGLRFPF